jgi:hypothetical protein
MVRLAYLTSPEPGKYHLNIQKTEAGVLVQFEIEDFHLANIVADGAHFLLRKSILHKEREKK